MYYTDEFEKALGDIVEAIDEELTKYHKEHEEILKEIKKLREALEKRAR